MPFDGLPETEIDELRRFFDRVLDEALSRGETSYSISTAHLRFGEIYDLMFDPRIVGPVTDLLGPTSSPGGRTFSASFRMMANACPGIRIAPIGRSRLPAQSQFGLQ